MAEQSLEEFAAWAQRRADEIARMDHRAVLEVILQDLIESVTACFDQSHDPDGRAWKALDVPFRKPLWGKRRQMIRRVLAAHEAAEIGRTALVIRIDPTVQMLHNEGRQKRPMREFLGFGQEQLERDAALVAEEVAKALVK